MTLDSRGHQCMNMLIVVMLLTILGHKIHRSFSEHKREPTTEQFVRSIKDSLQITHGKIQAYLRYKSGQFSK